MNGGGGQSLMMDTGDKNSTALNTFPPINRGCANLDTEGEIAKKKIYVVKG